jgi:hypothetical protein
VYLPREALLKCDARPAIFKNEMQPLRELVRVRLGIEARRSRGFGVRKKPQDGPR